MTDRNSPTNELEAAVESYWVPNPFLDGESFEKPFVKALLKASKEACGKLPCVSVLAGLLDVVSEIYENNGLSHIEFVRQCPTDSVERGRYRDWLLLLIELSQYAPDAWQQALFSRALTLCVTFLQSLPDYLFVDVIDPDEKYGGPTMPAIEAIDDIPELIDTILNVLTEGEPPPAYFHLEHQLIVNFERQHRICAMESKLSPPELVRRYFADTPLLSLFSFAVPDITRVQETLRQQREHSEESERRRHERLEEAAERRRERLEDAERMRQEQRAEAEAVKHEAEEARRRVEEERIREEERLKHELPNQIDPRTWYSHALLLAQPGSGKTNALRWRIVQLIPQIREGKASLILMEPKGVLCHEMLTLARAQGLEERVVLIDPIDAPVAVNLFDRGDGSPQAINETIGRVSRVLGTISTEMTPMQRETLTFAIRALFAQPASPTLSALTDILRHGKKVLDLTILPPGTRDFFNMDFDERDGRYIIARLRSLTANPLFETLFSPEQHTFDIPAEIQAGRLIVINCGEDDSLYGRFWIEEVARCIRPRFAIPEHRRMPTFFIIDEADAYIKDDDHFPTILDRAREARIGLFIAFQHMAQINSLHVRDSLYNCALKFVARTNADIHNLCRSMGATDTDFVGTMPQFHFAFHSPGMQRAAKVILPLVEFAPGRMEDKTAFANRSGYDPPRTVSEYNTAETFAPISPIAAVLETRRDFEVAVRKAVLSLCLPDLGAGATLLMMLKALQEHRIVDASMTKELHDLRRFGNNAQHNPDAILTEDDAVRFRQAVNEVIRSLQSRITQIPPSRPEAHHVHFDTDWKG